jgi:hypothetical protein
MSTPTTKSEPQLYAERCFTYDRYRVAQMKAKDARREELIARKACHAAAEAWLNESKKKTPIGIVLCLASEFLSHEKHRTSN